MVMINATKSQISKSFLLCDILCALGMTGRTNCTTCQVDFFFPFWFRQALEKTLRHPRPRMDF